MAKAKKVKTPPRKRTELHVFVHEDQMSSTMGASIDEMLRLLLKLVKQGGDLMADLASLTVQVKANTDAEDAAVVLLTQLAGMLVACKNDPAAIQKLADDLKAHADPLAAAVVANTPAETPPAP